MAEPTDSDSGLPEPTKLRQALAQGWVVQIKQKSLLVILVSWLLLVLLYASPEQIRFSNLDSDRQLANLIWQLPLTAYGVHLLFESPRKRLTMLLAPPIAIFLSIAVLGMTQGSILSAFLTGFSVFTSTNLKLVASQPSDDAWSINTYSYLLPPPNQNRQCKRQEKRLTSALLQVKLVDRLEDSASD